MSQIVNTLPAMPDDLPYDNYFLYHLTGSDTYRCCNFDYFISNTLDSNNTIYYHNRISYDYDSSSDSWVLTNIYNGNTPFVGNLQLIASTVDIYNSDGTLYCSATKKEYFTSNISLISTSITSSTITSALNDIKFIFPFLFVVLISCIAFRKSWRFLRGCIKGA